MASIATETHEKYEHLSPFMGKMVSQKAGRVLNGCPYGCQDHEIDPETGYCDHLIGFVNGDRDGMPLPTFEVLLPVRDADGVLIRRVIRVTKDCPRRERLKTDKLVRLTNCYRVYRENPGPPWIIPAKPAKAEAAK